MKKLIYINILILSLGICFAQQASDYFTVNPGLRWQFISTPLDSSSNEIDSLEYHRWDLFISEADFEGKSAKILQTKSGPEETIAFQPYVDSIFYHFSGANGYEYFKLGVIENLIFLLDSLITDSTFSVLSFFQSLEQWYSVYRFAQSIGDEYTIFQIDTTITINANTIPIRLKYLGKRLQDETIATGIGTFDCKKFRRTIGVSYLVILPPPLPPLEFPILSLHDYIWITENFWIVQGLIPPTDVDLQFIGYGAFYIPGLSTKLDKITAIEDEKDLRFPDTYVLMQNYPNPFNPSTKISWQSPVGSWQTLKIYDVLGNEVATLVDEYKPAGSYEVEFNVASHSGKNRNLTSGIYFYQLKVTDPESSLPAGQAGSGQGFVETKKMLLLK